MSGLNSCVVCITANLNRRSVEMVFITKIVVCVILLFGMVSNYKLLPPIPALFMMIVTIFVIILMLADE